MALIWRVLAAFVAVNFLTLSVFLGMATLQYDAILSSLVKDRLLVLIETVRDPFQAVADIGVPLSTVRNADAVLERARLSDASITGIYVISHEGEIAHFTAAHPLDTAAITSTRPADGRADWQSETQESFLIGTVVRSAFGAEAGSIVLEYSKHEAKIRTQAMLARLALIALGLIAATVALGWLLMRVALGEHIRIFEGILRSFDLFERRFWRGEDRTAVDDPDVSGLGVSTREFRELLEKSEARYQAARTVSCTTETRS